MMNYLIVLLGFNLQRRFIRCDDHSAIQQYLLSILGSKILPSNWTLRLLCSETLHNEALQEIRLVKTNDQPSASIRLLSEPDETIQVEPDIFRRIVIELSETISGNGISLPKIDISIRCSRDAMNKAQRHAEGHPRLEVGGFCVGYVTQVQNYGWLVDVTDTFPATHTVNNSVHVTFTPDTWSKAVKVIETHYTQGEQMLGWYHTHPGYRVFFSGDDKIAHQIAFTQPWHIALVIDPINRDIGFFVWSKDDHNQRVLVRLPDTRLAFYTNLSLASQESTGCSSQPPAIDSSNLPAATDNALEPGQI